MSERPDTDATSRRGPAPRVPLPRQALPGIVIAAGTGMAAILLFVALNGQRHRRLVATPVATEANAFAAPPPLRLPPLPPPVAAIPVVPPAPAPPMAFVRPAPPPPGVPAPVRRTAMPVALPIRQMPYVTPMPAAPPPRDAKAGSSIVFDLGPTAPSPASPPRPAENGDDAPVKAAAIANRTDVMPAGTQIPIVLETPIDTSRPGLVRAIASRDTRGFDGQRILIARGSRLIGDYQGDIRSGQNRVLVTWSRVIRPDGVTIRLASPATDRLGGAGVPGRVNSFFLERFTGAVLQSALTFGANLAYRQQSGPVIVGIPSAPVASIGQGLLPTDYRPKITVRQGALLNVFVARDLDFSTLMTGQR